MIGSFLNVCIVRWPVGGSVLRPARSACPRCGHEITWWENVPMVSWLALRGRCRGCGERISPLYPVVELAVALGWLASYAVFGPTLDALRVAVFGTVLLGIAATDARHYVIPDGFTVFLLVWCVATSVFGPAPGASATFASPYEALVGACAGAGAIAIIGWLGELAFKREAMGFGDVTMMAGVGAALGPERALLTVIVGAFLGAVVAALVIVPARLLLARRETAGGGGVGAPAGASVSAAVSGGAPGAGDDAGEGEDDGASRALGEIPFGVFLAPAALLTLLTGDSLLAWYFTRVLTP
jgi:leader peptidase (prepilin peptidase)/N-methyltransferase